MKTKKMCVCKSLLISMLGCVCLSSPVANGQLLNEDIELSGRFSHFEEFFGSAVVIDQGVVAVGTKFSVYHGHRSGEVNLYDVNTGEHFLQIFPDDPEEGKQFGISLAIENDVLIVGARGDRESGGGFSSGAVYLFDLLTGVQLMKLTANDGEIFDDFGFSVAVDNGILAVGAIGDDDMGDAAGAVYLFDLSTGTFLRKIHANDGGDLDFFGLSISIENDTILVGAPTTFSAGDGAAYVFDVSSGVQDNKFEPSTLQSGGRFGGAVILQGSIVVVGSPGRHGNDGSVFVYDLPSGDLVYEKSEFFSGFGHGERFGTSLALDFGFLVVGSPRTDWSNNQGQSAGYVHVYNVVNGLLIDNVPPVWLGDFGNFGTSVAIQNGKIITGAIGVNGLDQESGRAYVYNLFTGNNGATIDPPYVEPAFENFGYEIAAGDGIMAVSANKNDVHGDNAGIAHLFDSTTGERIRTYYPIPGSDNANFGYAMDLVDTTLVIGARDESGIGANGINGGAVYVYAALTGERIQRITPNDAQAIHFFGASVGLDLDINDDGLLAIGASRDDDMGDDAGAVYVFNPMTGDQVEKFYADDAAAGDAFGSVLAVDDGLIAIGSPLNDDLGTSSGSAYIFDIETGNQLFKLLADDGTAGNSFGSAISISGGIVAVGAWQRGDNGAMSGAVYLFDASTGVQTHKLLPDDGAADDRFGFSVSISNGKVLVGAYRDNVFGTWSGSAYIFDALTGVQLEKLAPAAGDPQELFGRSVSIHNTNIGVSAIGNGDAGFKAGSAYVFTLPESQCPADLTGDGQLNFFDVSAFLQAFAASDPSADFTGDGMFNFFDVSAFLQAFAAGCP